MTARVGAVHGALLVATAVGVLLVSTNRVVGDVPVYEAGVRRLLNGERPWVDFVYEYPPWSMALNLAPSLAAPGAGFRFVFVVEMLALHLLLAWVLLREGERSLVGWARYAPFWLLTLGAIFLEYLYFKRFDLAPATASVLAVVASRDGRHGWAMAWLMVGVGLKLYPAVLMAPLLVRAWSSGRLREAVLGLTLGGLPLLGLLLAGFPWLRVLTFHSGRGLQAESLGGAFLWLGHHLSWVDAQWNTLEKWTEVGGPLAPTVQRVTSVLLLLAVAASVIRSSWFLWKKESPSLADLARAALTPLLALLVFSSVLSPQFLIWIIGLCALTMTDGRWRTGLWCLLATALVPLFFPSRDYDTGLTLFSTSALVLRNLLLGWAWVDTWRLLRSAP